MNTTIVNVAIQELPLVIELMRFLFKRAEPDAPVPTDAEIIKAYQAAMESSLAKDEAWLAAHPERK